MLALSGVWIALASFFVALAMVLYRPLFTDVTVTLVLYFGSPGALFFAGLVLWAYRKEPTTDPGIRAQRVQAKVAIAVAVLAASIVYLLIFRSQKLEPIVPPVTTAYNHAGWKNEVDRSVEVAGHAHHS